MMELECEEDYEGQSMNLPEFMDPIRFMDTNNMISSSYSLSDIKLINLSESIMQEECDEIIDLDGSFGNKIELTDIEAKKVDPSESEGSTDSVEAEDNKKSRFRTRKHPDLRKTQTRVDVRYKKIYRSIMWILKNKFEQKLKDVEDPIEKAQRLMEILEGYRHLFDNQTEFVQVFFIVASKTLKTRFEHTVLKENVFRQLYLSRADVRNQIEAVKNFGSMIGELSYKDNKSKVSNHPILKLAKYVTLYEDERQEKFWDLIFRGKAEYQLSY